MEETIGKRILRIAHRMGMNPEILLVRAGFDKGRLFSIFYHGAKPQSLEIDRLAKAIGVNSAELENGRVETLLKQEGQEWRYPRLWHKILTQTGLRGGQTDPTLLKELLEEDMREQLWNPDEPPPWW